MKWMSFFKQKNKLLTFLLIVITGALQAQVDKTYIRKFSYTQGLTTQTIYDLYVDANGLLHMGTDKGLVSYNGVFFKTYPFQGNLALSVNSIQDDAKGKIWCKNFSNQLFYLENDTLKAYTKVEKLFKDNENLVDFTFFNNRLYILTEKGLFYENEKQELIQIRLKTSIKDAFFYSIFVDESSNRLLLGGNKNIIELTSSHSISRTRPAPQKQIQVAATKKNLIYFNKRNDTKIYINDESLIINPNGNENFNFYNLAYTRESHWLCTSNGLFELDISQKKVIEHVLENQRITDVVEDLEGNHWISSTDAGLFFIPNKKMKILPTQNTTPASTNFTSIASNDKGELFAGTSRGKIYHYHQDKTLKKIYTAERNVEIEYIYPLEDAFVTSAGYFEEENTRPKISAYLGKDITQDEFGNFVLGNYNLAGLIPQSFVGTPSIQGKLEVKTPTPYNTSQLFLYPFRNKRARAVHYSKKFKSYYLGYSDGLYKFSLDGSITEIKTHKDKPIIAMDFNEAEDGTIWVASSQEGVIAIMDQKVKKQLTTQDGLSNTKCKKIQTDWDGIWIVTEESLDFFDFRQDRIKNYGINLGLNGISINDFYVDNEHIWFATNEGIIFLPKAYLEMQLNPYFEIEAYQKEGIPLKANDAISYSKNTLLINFKSILYKSLGNFEYEYKLEPFHTEWQSQNAKQTQLNFAALQPNDYQLKARIKTGSIRTAEIVFPFMVQKPFWIQTWFIVLLFLILIIIFQLVYNWAVLKTKKQQNIKEMLAISQLTALRSQMNPHFMFNVLNAVQGLIYSNQKNKANEYIGTFSTLMRKTLDLSSQSEVTIAEEIETIQLYVSLEKARFEEDEFCYEIILPKEDLKAFTIPSLIIQPFIENAIKHGLLHKRGKKKLLFVVSKKSEKYWQFCIEDNGVGRKMSQHINQKIHKNHNSFATHAIESRIELMNKLTDLPITIHFEDLFNTYNEAIGTRVTLLIPIKRVKLHTQENY